MQTIMKEPTDDEIFNRTEPRLQARIKARDLLYLPVRWFILGLYFIGNVAIGSFLALAIVGLWISDLIHGNN